MWGWNSKTVYPAVGVQELRIGPETETGNTATSLDQLLASYQVLVAPPMGNCKLNGPCSPTDVFSRTSGV